MKKIKNRKMTLKIIAQSTKQIVIEADVDSQLWKTSSEEERQIYIKQQLKDHITENVDDIVDEIVEGMSIKLFLNNES